MLQRLMHGAQIDTATPREVADIIAGAFKERETRHYRREKDVILLDATGAGQTVFKTTRLYSWRCERVTLAMSAVQAGVTPIIEFYDNQIAPTDMLEVVGLGTAGLYSDAFSNTLFIPAGDQLIVACTGGGIGAQLSINIQIELIRVQG